MRSCQAPALAASSGAIAQVLAEEGSVGERFQRVVRKGHMMNMVKLSEALQQDLGNLTFHEARPAHPPG